MIKQLFGFFSRNILSYLLHDLPVLLISRIFSSLLILLSDTL